MQNSHEYDLKLPRIFSETSRTYITLRFPDKRFFTNLGAKKHGENNANYLIFNQIKVAEVLFFLYLCA